MKRRQTLIALTAALALGFQSMAVCSAPLKLVPARGDEPSRLSGKLKTSHLGMLKVPQGLVKLSDNDIEVGAVPDWLFDRHTVLKGKLLTFSIDNSKQATYVTGLVYFAGGEWLNSLDNFKRKDNLKLTDNSVLTGKIRSVNETSVDFTEDSGKTRRIENSLMDSIESPRAFYFRIPASAVKIDPTNGHINGEAGDIAFTPTTAVRKKGLFAKKEPVEPKSQLAGAEGGVTKAALAGMLFLDVVNTIAPAIVAPIVAPLSTRSADQGIQEFNQNDALAQRGGFVIIP
ncbi:MAG: hypothetical protein K8F91_00195 [Candidatus Obscuribacterales bacterium]|nr:hypothetical protein [Candidatus Obscuribacterales bacterium]